jgi:hypothetical protein
MVYGMSFSLGYTCNSWVSKAARGGRLETWNGGGLIDFRFNNTGQKSQPGLNLRKNKKSLVNT